MEVHLTGAYPRSEELIEITRAVARGKASQENLEAGLNRDVNALVDQQRRVGLDFLVDGQLNWQDLFRPFSELFTGIRPGSLTRWFDNNTFYRKPLIVDSVKFAGSNLDNYFKYQALKDARKKVILPGPFTFAAMSNSSVHESFADLVDELAHALRDLAVRLCELGYEYVQFNEPSVCFDRRPQVELETLKPAYDVCAKGIGCETALHTYFGDASSVIGSILDCSVDCVGVDFYAASIESLGKHDFDKKLACGCIDGRNSLLESPDDLKKQVSRIQEKINPRGIALTPNCDLEFLPLRIADKKLQILAKARSL